MSALGLAAMVALPFGMGVIAALWAGVRPSPALRASLVAAIGLAALATLLPLDVALVLPSGRSLVLSPIAQFTIQLMSLAALGLTLTLANGPPRRVPRWLPVLWCSVGGLCVSLLLSAPSPSGPRPALPLAFLTFIASTLIWVMGLPPERRTATGGPVLRYAALLAIALPLLLGAFRIAEGQLTSPAGRIAVERTALALALPGFGLVLGLMPLHAWTLTLASGAPRPMLFGVLGVVQTAGFGLLLRTLDTHEWLFRGDYGGIVVLGGAVTAAVAAWLALSADPDDPDDWLAYAAVANMGMLVTGLGSGARMAGTGTALLLLARVLALLLLSLRTGASLRRRRLADGAAVLTLAGTPGLAGFPGFWLILAGTRSAGGLAPLLLVAASGFLFATGLRRTLFARAVDDAEEVAPPRPALPKEGVRWIDRSILPKGPDRAIAVMTVLLVLLGLVPQLVAGAMVDPLRDIYFPDPGAVTSGQDAVRVAPLAAVDRLPADSFRPAQLRHEGLRAEIATTVRPQLLEQPLGESQAL